MTTLQASQHIYSNVEKEQSPQGRGGFQTLFYTHAGLTQAEVEEMEGRLLYFPAKAGNSPVKRLFFSTASGKQVIAQIVPIAAPDQYGRGGRYLAHSLIFTAEAMQKIEVNPFVVHRNFQFVVTVEAALALGTAGSGNIPAVQLTLPAAFEPEQAVRNWPTAAFKKLALLALRVQAQTQAREAITVTGPPAQIEAALDAAFMVLPAALRPHCTFDTYFYRCNLVSSYYWAIGLPEPPAGVKFAHVNAAAQQVQTDINGQPQTSYESWVLHMIEHQQAANFPTQREDAFTVAEWLDGRAFDAARLDAVKPGLVAEMFNICANTVRKALHRKIRAYLPEPLDERAVEQIYRETTATGQLYGYLRHEIQVQALVELLYKSYQMEKFTEPSRREKKELEKLLQQPVQHDLLPLILAFWESPRKALPSQLQQVDEDIYRKFVALALAHRLVEPLTLLVPGLANVFLSLYLAQKNVDAVAAAEALINIDAPEQLLQLTPHLAPLSRKELESLEKLAEKHRPAAPTFFQAVEQQLAALPPEKGIAGVLKSLWNKLPGV